MEVYGKEKVYNIQEKGWQTFSKKDQTVNILDFEGHTISVTITQICYCREKTAVDIT